MSDTRQHLHHLIDQFPESKLEAIKEQLEEQLDPFSRKLANAPYEDEEITEDEERKVEEAREWLKHNKAIPMEEVLADFGLTMESFERMGTTPPPGGKKN
jgi:hypothetical protein